MPPRSGQTIAGKYRLEHPLARGGMGTVWRARHLELDIVVAVKLVVEQLLDDDSIRLRLKREAKAAAQLRSRHITHIYDYGDDQGVAYIVMELLDGEDLRQRLRRERRLTPAACVEIVQQLCRGLARAHAAGIVHRDLKPSNVFLTRDDRGDMLVKLLDFGIAKETRSQLVVSERTETGLLIGSPHYMSPEQASGGKVDQRSDLWSVAVIAYQMLTGQRPFDGSHLGTVIAKLMAPKPIAVSTMPLDLPETLDRFFDFIFRVDPDERYVNAAALADAFSAAIEGRVVPEPEHTDDQRATHVLPAIEDRLPAHAEIGALASGIRARKDTDKILDDEEARSPARSEPPPREPLASHRPDTHSEPPPREPLTSHRPSEPPPREPLTSHRPSEPPPREPLASHRPSAPSMPSHSDSRPSTPAAFSAPTAHGATTAHVEPPAEPHAESATALTGTTAIGPHSRAEGRTNAPPWGWIAASLLLLTLLVAGLRTLMADPASAVLTRAAAITAERAYSSLVTYSITMRVPPSTSASTASTKPEPNSSAKPKAITKPKTSAKPKPAKPDTSAKPKAITKPNPRPQPRPRPVAPKPTTDPLFGLPHR